MSSKVKNPVAYALVTLVLILGSILATASLAHSGPSDTIGGLTQFQAVEPCRIVDTRNSGSWGQIGWFSPGEQRMYDVQGIRGSDYFLDQGAQGCNIPSTATAVELTFTAIEPAGKGFMRAWPAGAGATAPGATVLNYTGGLYLNPTNSVTVAISPGSWDPFGGELGVRNYSGWTDLAIDVTGYYE